MATRRSVVSAEGVGDFEPLWIGGLATVADRGE